MLDASSPAATRVRAADGAIGPRWPRDRDRGHRSANIGTGTNSRNDYNESCLTNVIGFLEGEGYRLNLTNLRA
jgi:hypothetical protein